MVVAPTSTSDIERAQRIGEVNARVGGASPPQGLLTQHAEKMITTTMQSTCRQCKTSLAAAAKFCAECGTAVQPTAYSD
jgi:hypothetical protein